MVLVANLKRQLCFPTNTSSQSSANNKTQGWLSLFALLLIFILRIKPPLSVLHGSSPGLLSFNTQHWEGGQYHPTSLLQLYCQILTGSEIERVEKQVGA